MKILVLCIGLICVMIPLVLLFKDVNESKSIKERIGMLFGFFYEPLDPWAMLFYIGFLGLLYGVIFL